MGTRTIFWLALGVCIAAVSAQYPFNSLYHQQEKDLRYRPQPHIPHPSQSRPSQGHQQLGGGGGQYQSNEEESKDPAKFAKIMKQINKVNDDGSYTFGFENDDGSFRVETRTKDGLVKGKYGFVDGNGQLKVTEYTAGEKSEDPEVENDPDTTESEEEGGDFKRPRPSPVRSLPLSARPQAQAQQPFLPSRPYILPQQPGARHVIQASPSPYRIGSRSASFDQSPAAQTNQKVESAPPTSDNDFQEDEESDFQKRQSQSQEDPLNGQYFRSSVNPASSGPSRATPARGRFPGGRPLYSQAGAGPSAYAQQYPGRIATQGFAGPGPQGFSGAPQGFQGGPPPGAFGGPQFLPQGFPGGFPGPAGPGPQGFRRIQSAPQDFSSIGNPNSRAGGPSGSGQGQQQQVQIQNFGGFGGNAPRQGSKGSKGDEGHVPGEDERYVPSVELDGYSEDLDEDGYPDDPPKNGQLPTKSNSGSGSFGPRPFPIQGGVQPGPGLQGASRGAAPQPQIILQLGPQGGAPIQGSRFPASAGSPQGQGGFPQQYVPQQNFGGFPDSPQGFPQGFPPGFNSQDFASSPQGFPQNFQQIPQSPPSRQPARFGETGGESGQGQGFPYEFSPFGGSGFPSGPQGFPAPQGFPSAAGGGGGQQVQNFGGFPVGGPGRFSGPGAGAGGAQSFSSGGLFGAGGASPGSSSQADKKP